MRKQRSRAAGLDRGSMVERSTAHETLGDDLFPMNAFWASPYWCHVRAGECTAFAGTYTVLAIHGGRLTAGCEEIYGFLAELCETNQFSFDQLVPWLRIHAMLQRSDRL